MAISQRHIFGKPADLAQSKATNYVDGGDDSLASRDYVAPLDVTDQASPQTQAERDSLARTFKASQDQAARIDGSGATGKALS